jgi:two-component system response regulator
MIAPILLLEDAELDVMLAKRALARVAPAAPVLHAEDGEIAWNYLTGKGELGGQILDGKPMFALLDIRVPKIGGLELLSKIRSHDVLKDMVVIMMSSSDDERDLAEARRCRASAYVRKVIDSSLFVEDLVTAIKPLISGNSASTFVAAPALKLCLTST